MTHSTTPMQTTAPPVLWKNYLTFLVPMIVSNILQALSGTINNIYLGQYLGVQGMAAVSAFFPVLFFFIAFMIGLGSGSAVLIGQAWGAHKPARAKAIAAATLTAGMYAGVVIAVFGALFAEPILQLLGTPKDILDSSTNYARVMFIACPGLFVFILATSMLRGVSDTRTPLLTLLISTAVGLCITPLLILGAFGLPQLGISSGAYAAAASYIVSLSWLVWFLRKKSHPLAPDAQFIQMMRLDFEVLRKVIRIGLPTALSMITVSLSEIAVLFLVNRYGSQATAAYGAVNQIVSYVQFPAISIAITASILGAQAIGGKRIHLLGKIAYTGVMLNLVLTGSLVLIGYLFSRHIIGLFITDTVVIDMAQTLLHIMLWGNVILGMSMVLSGLMRASGTVVIPTGINIGCIACIEIPTAWWLSQTYGINGIWASYPITFICMLTLQTLYYKLVWLKKPIHAL